MWDAWPRSRPLIVSHRALAPGQRENTLAGAHAAFASGAEAIEVDVRRTCDGVPVLHHDPDLGGLPVAGTRFSDLQARADSLGYELARPSEVLETPGAVDLEIKDPAATSLVLDLLDDVDAGPVLVSGFDPHVVAEVNERAPSVPTGLIVGPRRIHRLVFSPRRARRARSWLAGTRPDMLVVHRSFLHWGVASTVFGLGLPVAAWTVNRARSLARAMGHPLMWGVITDRPAAAHHARGLVGGRDGHLGKRIGRESNRSRQPG